MKRPILKIALLLLSIAFLLPARAQTWKWATGSISPKSFIECWTVAADQMGNVYSAGNSGSFSYPFDSVKCYFGSDTVIAPRSIVIVSTDSNGHYRWAMGATAGFGEPSNVVTDNENNLYVFGFYSSNITIGGLSLSGGGSYGSFCAKISSSGSMVWLKNVAGGYGWPFGAVDAVGNVYVTGSYKGAHLTIGTTTLTNSDPTGVTTDIYVAKLDSSGNPLWAMGLGGDTSETAYGISVTGNGKVSISGIYSSNIFHAGTHTLTHLPASTNSNLYVVQLSTTGVVSWARQLDAASYAIIAGIAVDNINNTYVTGAYDMYLGIGADTLAYSPGSTMYLAKFSPTGLLVWARAFDGFKNPGALAVDHCGVVWVAGSGAAPGSPYGIDKMYLVKLDSAGTMHDTIDVPVGGDDAMGISVDYNGNLYLGADYYVNAMIGPDSLVLRDSTEEPLFVARYSYPVCATGEGSLITKRSEITGNAIRIYPNPVSDECIVQTNNPATLITRIEIFDFTGRLVYEGSPDRNFITLSLSNFRPGVYTCKITSGNHVINIEKLIKN